MRRLLAEFYAADVVRLKELAPDLDLSLWPGLTREALAADVGTPHPVAAAAGPEDDETPHPDGEASRD